MSPLRDEPVEPVIVSSDLVYSGRVWDVRSDTVRGTSIAIGASRPVMKHATCVRRTTRWTTQ